MRVPGSLASFAAAAAAIAIVLAVHGCGGSPSLMRASGLLSVVVRWPNAHVAALYPADIPDDTEEIHLTVSAPDLDTPLTLDPPITRSDVVDGVARAERYVPAGSGRKITVEALDARGDVVAAGSATVDIVAGTRNTIRIQITEDGQVVVTIDGPENDAGRVGVDVDGPEGEPGEVDVGVDGPEGDPGEVDVGVDGPEGEPGEVDVGVDGPEEDPGGVDVGVDGPEEDPGSIEIVVQ